jgi:iduronate 2-sulfatase
VGTFFVISFTRHLPNRQARRPYPALTTYDFSEFSVRSERWRYTRLIVGSEELYDHQNDPEEWHNLATDPAYAKTKTDLAD